MGRLRRLVSYITRSTNSYRPSTVLPCTYRIWPTAYHSPLGHAIAHAVGSTWLFPGSRRRGVHGIVVISHHPQRSPSRMARLLSSAGGVVRLLVGAPASHASGTLLRIGPTADWDN